MPATALQHASDGSIFDSSHCSIFGACDTGKAKEIWRSAPSDTLRPVAPHTPTRLSVLKKLQSVCCVAWKADLLRCLKGRVGDGSHAPLILKKLQSVMLCFVVYRNVDVHYYAAAMMQCHYYSGNYINSVLLLAGQLDSPGADGFLIISFSYDGLQACSRRPMQ